MKWVHWFVTDYVSRHRNPWCRLLHLVGVPLAPFLFLYLLFQGQFLAAGVAFLAGYSLQWVGHRIEGNEVGEWTLLKAIWRRLTGRAARGEARADL